MTAIPAFVVPEPGETIHSVVARYIKRSGSSATKLLAMLHMTNSAPHALIPPGLYRMVEVLPVGHPWRNNIAPIIDHHTLVPLHLRFATAERRRELLTTFYAHGSKNPTASLGVTARPSIWSSAQTYKFCPQCVVRDRAHLGFPVSYREHQPAFVRLCVVHECALLEGCQQCFTTRRGVNLWMMAGDCECRNARFELKQPFTDPAYVTDLLWLATQAKLMLSAERASNLGTALDLEAGLRSQFGLSKPSHIASIIEALRSAFSNRLFTEMCNAQVLSTDSRSRWIQRTFDRIRLADGIPDALRCVLLSRLLAQSTSTLPNSASTSLEVRAPREPIGYRPRASARHAGIDSNELQRALQNHQYVLNRVAKQFRMSVGDVLATLRHWEIQFPMPSRVREKIGEERLKEALHGILQGEPKKPLARKLGLSAGQLLYIELDSLEVAKLHRKAAIERTRNLHRTAVLALIEGGVYCTRSEVAARLAGPVTWLRKYDYEWFKATLPVARRAPDSFLSPTRDERDANRDEHYARRVRELASTELRREAKPRWMSYTFLLRTVGVNITKVSRLPLTVQTAKDLAEDTDAFRRRRILWALQKYKVLDVPYSVNKFRRVAQLQSEAIAPHSDFIAAELIKMGIEAHGRSVLGRSRR